MDFLVTLFYLPAYLIGIGISIIIWYIILSFAFEHISEWWNYFRYKRNESKHVIHDDIDDYY